MLKKLVFAAVLLVPLVFGQSERGTLTGVVLDASGAAIARPARTALKSRFPASAASWKTASR